MSERGLSTFSPPRWLALPIPQRLSIPRVLLMNLVYLLLDSYPVVDTPSNKLRVLRPPHINQLRQFRLLSFTSHPTSAQQHQFRVLRIRISFRASKQTCIHGTSCVVRFEFQATNTQGMWKFDRVVKTSTLRLILIFRT